MAAQDSPLKQLTRLLSRSAGLEAAREGSWHIFLLKVGVREEEEAAVIELTKFLVSCLGLNGLQKRLEKCQVLRLALSHIGAAFQCGPGPSAQGDFFSIFIPFAALVLGC